MAFHRKAELLLDVNRDKEILKDKYSCLLQRAYVYGVGEGDLS